MSSLITMANVIANNSAEFKNILLSKGENMMINSGNIITENQLRAVGAMSSADEARESLKEALRAHFGHESIDIFTVPLEPTFECRNSKLVDIINPDDRCSLRITVKLFVSSCDPKLVEDALEQCLRELGVSSIDAVILKTQGLETPCKDADLQVAPLSDISNEEAHNCGCRLLKCYEVLERYYDAGKITEIGITDVDDLETLEKILQYVRVKPTVNQLHQSTCETLGSEVVEFADANHIELLTHNDPEDMLASVDASVIMSSLFWDDSERLQAATRHHDNLAMASQDGGNDVGLPSTSFQKSSGLPLVATPNWHFRWLARFSCVVKCRGVITSKGYIARLGRDLRHLPPAVVDPAMSASL